MKTITFIRHGQTESNLSKLISGQTQTPLTQAGIEELKQLKKQLNYPEAEILFASDLERAIETAKIIYDNQEVKVSELFREIEFGPYEGVPMATGTDEFYVHFLSDSQQGEMETYSTLKKRVEKAFGFVIEELNKEQKNKATIVAHNGFLRMVNHIYAPTSKEDYRNFTTDNGHGFSLILDDYAKLVEVVYF